MSKENALAASDLTQLRQLIQSSAHFSYEEIRHFFNETSQLKSLGIHVDWIKPGEAQLSIAEIKDIHKGGLGSSAINGGIIALICDMTLGLLGADYWQEGYNATQNLSIDYLKPLLANKVIAHGKVERLVGKKLVALIEVSNENGEVCSCAHGILATGLK